MQLMRRRPGVCLAGGVIPRTAAFVVYQICTPFNHTGGSGVRFTGRVVSVPTLSFVYQFCTSADVVCRSS